jgi:hypothetical protein
MLMVAMVADRSEKTWRFLGYGAGDDCGSYASGLCDMWFAEVEREREAPKEK